MDSPHIIWYGDLSGFTIEVVDYGETLTLNHRCGWSTDLEDADVYLANIVAKALTHVDCKEEGTWYK